MKPVTSFSKPRPTARRPIVGWLRPMALLLAVGLQAGAPSPTGILQIRDGYFWDPVRAEYYDLIQWRKQSIGDYVAIGAMAAQQADPHHLRTYSMVGAVFSNLDANHTCEDARTIVARCAAAGAPLHFWSVNNYARQNPRLRPSSLVPSTSSRCGGKTCLQRSWETPCHWIGQRCGIPPRLISSGTK